MTTALEKEDLWFQEWFRSLCAMGSLGHGALPPQGAGGQEASAFDEEAIQIDEVLNPAQALRCVTSLYQQECFPYLYIQKNTGVFRNQRTLLSVTMILRTHYEGAEKEALCLKKIRSTMAQPFQDPKTETTTYFQEKTMAPKITDKKMREVWLTYDARIVWNCKNLHQDRVL